MYQVIKRRKNKVDVIYTDINTLEEAKELLIKAQLNGYRSLNIAQLVPYGANLKELKIIM